MQTFTKTEKYSSPHKIYLDTLILPKQNVPLLAGRMSAQLLLAPSWNYNCLKKEK